MILRRRHLGRLIGGVSLIGLALFMVLGFVRSSADPGSLASIIALLIVGVLPAASGTYLLARHFGYGNRLQERRAQLRLDTLYAEVLKLAGVHGGRLTVLEVSRELAMAPAEATEVLNALQARGEADIEVTDQGLIVYTFPDLHLLKDKHTSRGLLD